MSSNKHPKPGHETITLPADDLACDPGIGESRGATMAGGETQSRETPESIRGANTLEGDVANDVSYGGGIDPNQRGRTNK